MCVLTSWLEGVPRAIIEAGAAGRAVVATDVVGTRSILEDGTTGYLVPFDDANVLADRLFQLLTDEPLRTRMGENGEAHGFGAVRRASRGGPHQGGLQRGPQVTRTNGRSAASPAPFV